MLKTNFQTDKRCLPRKSAFDIFASEEYMFPEGYQPENAESASRIQIQSECVSFT